MLLCYIYEAAIVKILPRKTQPPFVVHEHQDFYLFLNEVISSYFCWIITEAGGHALGARGTMCPLLYAAPRPLLGQQEHRLLD